MRWTLFLGVCMAGCLLGALPAGTWAQTGAPDERSRIAEQRRQIEARHTQALRECSDRFLVAPCQADARAARRQALAELRARELALDDAERQRRAAVRRQAIQQKQQSSERGAASAPEVRTRSPRAAGPASAPRSAAAASAAASAPAAARHPAALDGGTASAAARATQASKRQVELQRRQAAIEARQQKQLERAKTHPQAAAPLPQPGKPASQP